MQISCVHCGASFASKTKLFAHLRASACTTAAVAAGLQAKDAFEKVALIIGSTARDDTWQHALWRAIDHARGVGVLPARASYAEQGGAPGASFASDARHLEALRQESDVVRICDVLSFSTEVVAGEAERQKWCDRANSALRPDVRILGRSAALPTDFHADGSCLRRYYECLIPMELLIPALKDAGKPPASTVPCVDEVPGVAEEVSVDALLPALRHYTCRVSVGAVTNGVKQSSQHVCRGSGDPRWGEGADREVCLTEFQHLKNILRRFQGEHRFHNFAPNSKLVPTEAVARRFVYKMKAGTELGHGICTLTVGADALLAGQLRAMAALSIGIQRRLLPESYIDVALGDTLLPSIPAIPGGTQYLASCIYSKQYHWLLQPLMDGDAVQAWRAKVQNELIHELSDPRQFVAWFQDELLPASLSACSRVAGNHVVCANGSCSPHQPLDCDTSEAEEAPPVYAEVLRLLRDVEASGKWPGISKGREKVIKSSTLAENGGGGGSFTLGSMPPPLDDPHGNSLFPELMRCVFELERTLLPERPASSTIAVNKHAEFLPHVDSGAGAGQSTSLIVGMGNYIGGELVLEGTSHDIRYKPMQFNGWTQRHWTLPFVGERFSLVWFTPKGCEDKSGLSQCGDFVLHKQNNASQDLPAENRSTSQTNISLSAGLELPTLGFGTFRLQGAACEAAITHALDSGFRLIDTGSIYKNEESVGSAIRAWAGDDASRRGSVLVTSKCSSYEMGYDRAIAACEASIQRLGVDAIDLYLIHWPAVAKKKHSSDIHRKARHETWCALEELHRRCRVRAIGVSNFTVAHLEQLLEDGVKVVPMVNQIEAHPFCIPSDVIAFCQGRGIVIQAYSPLGGGPYSNSAKDSGGEINGTNLLLGNAIVREIASETGRSAAQVLLRWGIEQGFVVLPQSTNPERIAENASVFNFSLNAAQVTRLSALAAQEGLTQKFCWDPSSVQ